MNCNRLQAFGRLAIGFIVACGMNPLSAQVTDLPTLDSGPEVVETFELENPVTVLDINDRPQILVGMEEGKLRIAFPNLPGAEAIVPVDGKASYVKIIRPEEMDSWVASAAKGNYGPMLNGLRPQVKPLVRFLVIPTTRTNLHELFLRYYESLILTGNLDEAVAVSTEMPWNRLSSEYMNLVERLVYRTIEEDNFEATEQLLSILSTVLTEEELANIAFPVADAARTAGAHGLASKIYGSLARSSDEELSEKSLLWAGYSKAVTGEAYQARMILDQVPEMERGDENFLTYCLARGRLSYAEENLNEGLRYLSQAMVLSSVKASFKPELYYLLTVGYGETGQDAAAERLAREFAIFYPDNPWLMKYQEEFGGSDETTLN
tara:strand:+ start:3074 stop:4207 length:1134 start_codon:yes stop_codon:yes gene_type:complete